MGVSVIGLEFGERQGGIAGGEEGEVPSSSLTDSPIVTEVSWFEYCRTIILVSSMPSLDVGSAVVEQPLWRSWHTDQPPA